MTTRWVCPRCGDERTLRAVVVLRADSQETLTCTCGGSITVTVEISPHKPKQPWGIPRPKNKH